MQQIQKVSPPISPASTSGAKKQISARDAASLKKSCQDFEAIFIQSLFKAMRKTVPDGGLFEKDTAHAIYQDMLDAKVAEEISSKQSLGFAEQMYRQMAEFLPESEKK